MILPQENNTIPLINGLVLAGGRSSRMGKDKGAIAYHGVSQREYVFNLLSHFCNETFLSCNKEQTSLFSQTFPVVEDRHESAGPLIGILSAFQQAPHAAWLVVACDLPFLSETTIEYLIQHRNAAKKATAFWNEDRTFPEPLITIWEPSSCEFLLTQYNNGKLCPRKALLNMDTELLQAPDSSELQNINYPQEFEQAIKQLTII